jgi:type II secretion system protein G
MKFKNNTGFTLIELIVAIGILGVMAVAAMVALNPFAQFQKANDAKRKADLSQIQKAVETYYQDYGKYPAFSVTSGHYYLNPIVTTPPPTTSQRQWGKSWQPYMNALPIDPTSSKSYVYYSTNNGQSYYLYASLDRGGNDPEACNKGATCKGITANAIPTTACGNGPGVVCNYGVASPDVTP